MICPVCGRFAEPDPETGYDCDDPCSERCAAILEEYEDRDDSDDPDH